VVVPPDTFVVRTIMNPCIMLLVGRRSWWPRSLPSDKSREDLQALLFDQPEADAL
jgi:uncharacterized membrane protein YdfJ with MMPL/SSD domain